MNKPLDSNAASRLQTQPQLLDTRDAFDSVAADYDGPRGNNDLIQDMRSEMWRWLDAVFTPTGRVSALGRGTGLHAVRLAKLTHFLTATDLTPKMALRTSGPAQRAHT